MKYKNCKNIMRILQAFYIKYSVNIQNIEYTQKLPDKTNNPIKMDK
jgi:hypothetical protein